MLCRPAGLMKLVSWIGPWVVVVLFGCEMVTVPSLATETLSASCGTVIRSDALQAGRIDEAGELDRALGGGGVVRLRDGDRAVLGNGDVERILRHRDQIGCSAGRPD